MKKKILVIGGAIVALLLLLAIVVPLLFLPEAYAVTRTEKIEAPPEQVYDLVNDLRTVTDWSPWIAMDPTMELTFSDDATGQGAWYTWKSEEMGTGKLTIVESEPPRLIRSKLDFEGGKMAAFSRFVFEPEDGGTRVSWAIEGDDGGRLVHRWFVAVMDSMVGPSCVDGLERLKKLAESRPAPAPATPDADAREPSGNPSEPG